MIKFNLIITIICTLFFSTAIATTLPEQTQLRDLGNEFLRAYQQDEKITALAITVYQIDHDVMKSAFIGTRGIKENKPIDKDCLFQTGSITKSFIAALLLKLEEDPKYNFNLNDPITKHFPEYKKWHNVTIKHLLQMTSGIPDYLIDKNSLLKYKKNPYQNYAPNTWINAMLQRPLLFKPGSQFHYSNTNYIILGLLIEKLTGHSLETELTEKIIKPLGLTYTYYVPEHPKSILMDNMVHGYQNQNNLLPYVPLGTDITNYNASFLQAAGCIYGTTENISRWIGALFTPGKVLSSAQLHKLTSFISEKNAKPVTILSNNDRYAYGMGISAEYDVKLDTIFYIYEGVTFGYRFLYLYSPKDKLVVTIAVNSNTIKKQNRLLALAKLIYLNRLANIK